MTLLARFAAVAILCVSLGSITLGSRVRYAANPAGDALIRLAWRAPGDAALHCRTPSAEELARLPVHMRRREICERRLPSFRLAVEIDGRRAIDEHIAPAGLRGDRPAVVLRELRLPPGAYQLRVTFTPDAGETAPLRLERALWLEPGGVALVLEDPGSRALILRSAAP